MRKKESHNGIEERAIEKEFSQQWGILDNDRKIDPAR